MKKIFYLVILLLSIAATNIGGYGVSTVDVPSIGQPGVGVGGGAAALLSYWADGVSVGNHESSANWQELSGMATPKLAANSNYLWIISDAPANMLAAVGKTDASNQGVWSFQTPPTFSDIEDIESATVNGVNYLYVFDFGNNPNSANSRGSGIDMRILRAIEPTITGTNGTITSGNYIAIDAAFPGVDGPTLRDCEASIVDPVDGKIYVITKRDAVQKVYSLAHAATYSGTQTLVYEGAMTSLPEGRTLALTTTPTFAVDAAINPAGTEIFVKNYQDVYLFPRNLATQTIIQALQQSLSVVVGYVGGGTYPDGGLTVKTSHPNAEPQGEGIAFDYNGVDYYSNSEYNATEGSTSTRYPLFKYSRLTKVPTTIIFQDGVSPTGAYAGTSDTYIWDTNPSTVYGTQTTYVLDRAIAVETDQRKALLKFDISTIPTTATVVGCRLDQWISAEGQGTKWHRLLKSFTESSTYNSFTPLMDDDGVGASIVETARNGVNLDTLFNINERANFLLSDCQLMVTTPATNYGWLGESTDLGGDGVQFDSRESATAARRPKLTMRYIN